MPAVGLHIQAPELPHRVGAGLVDGEIAVGSGGCLGAGGDRDRVERCLQGRLRAPLVERDVDIGLIGGHGVDRYAVGASGDAERLGRFLAEKVADDGGRVGVKRGIRRQTRVPYRRRREERAGGRGRRASALRVSALRASAIGTAALREAQRAGGRRAPLSGFHGARRMALALVTTGSAVAHPPMLWTRTRVSALMMPRSGLGGAGHKQQDDDRSEQVPAYGQGETVGSHEHRAFWDLWGTRRSVSGVHSMTRRLCARALSRAVGSGRSSTFAGAVLDVRLTHAVARVTRARQTGKRPGSPRLAPE